MALKCGSNFFGGNRAHTEPVRQGLVGVAMLVALSIAFTRAWAAATEDYAQKCPDKCKNKTGLVGFKFTFRTAGGRVTCSVSYIVIVRCSPTGRDEREPIPADYDRLAELAPPAISPARGGRRKRKR